MFVDERGPDVGGVGVLGDVVQHERFKGPRRWDGDLDEEIVASRDDEDGENVVKSSDHVSEVFDRLPGLGLQSYRDDGLHAAPHFSQVDLGVISGNHAALLQSTNPVVTGRVGNAKLAGDLTVAPPGIRPERGEDLLV